MCQFSHRGEKALSDNAVVIREGSNLFDTPEATNTHTREKTPGHASGHSFGHHFYFLTLFLEKFQRCEET